MFGFPKEFEDPFISAWTEPFTGFELKWIEVEICRQAMIPTNISDLFDKMRAKYPDLQEMHQSKFYRIVSSLVDAGYLEDTPDGRSKIIKTKSAGIKELGRITRYFFEIQMERFKDALWQDMIFKITEYTGCLIDSSNIVLGPEYNAINTLIYECSTCQARENGKKPENLEEFQGNFSFLDFEAVIENNTSSSSIWPLSEIDDWPFKEGLFDNVILLNPLITHQDHAISILNEAKRVVKPNGYVVVFEITRKDSNFVTTIMREATLFINYSNPNNSWKFPENVPDRSTVNEWIKKSNLNVVKEFPDVISTVLILQ